MVTDGIAIGHGRTTTSARHKESMIASDGALGTANADALAVILPDWIFQVLVLSWAAPYTSTGLGNTASLYRLASRHVRGARGVEGARTLDDDDGRAWTPRRMCAPRSSSDGRSSDLA